MKYSQVEGCSRVLSEQVRILFRPETHCVRVLRTHPVGSVVQKRHRFSPVLLLILQISSPLLVTPLLFMKQSLSDLYVNMPLLR